jgi:hypothetical protein
MSSSTIPEETTPLKRRRNDTSRDDEERSIRPVYQLQSTIQDFVQTNSFVLKAVLAIGIARWYPPLGAEYGMSILKSRPHGSPSCSSSP